MSELATLDITGRIGTLTLCREDARNALSIDLIAAVGGRLDEAAASGVSVLVVTGKGPAFCAGMDLKAVLGSPGMPSKLLHALSMMLLKLRSLSAVTIAKVNGAAIGGGCGLATVCDLAVTHADSKMGFPEVDLGVCPAVVAPWLVRKIGSGRARRVLLSGGLMSGSETLAAGIVDHLCENRGGLDSLAGSIAERLASGGPKALAATKELLNSLDGSLDKQLAARAADLSAQVLETPEARAMLRAKLGGAR